MREKAKEKKGHKGRTEKMTTEAESADGRARDIEKETTIYIYVIELLMRVGRERE